MIKIKTTLIFLFFLNYTFSQLNSSDFKQYLFKIREACNQKDSAKFHYLIGDDFTLVYCVTDSLTNSIEISNWQIFKNKFSLEKKETEFWSYFLEQSEGGYFSDSSSNLNFTPKYHSWGTGFPYQIPSLGHRVKILKNDTLILYVGSQMSNLKPQLFVPKVITIGQSYPYNFSELINGEFYICYENGEEIGFVKKESLEYWDNYFAFKKVNDEWRLSFYKFCPLK